MIITQEAKPSLNDLAHHGVLGMKWGHRKKANGTDIRKARLNLAAERHDIGAKAREVANTTKRGTAAREEGKKQLRDMNVAYLKNPDRVIAVRMTRGEKIAASLLVLTGIAAPAAVAGVVGTSAASRRVEQKQDTGAYDKKKK